MTSTSSDPTVSDDSLWTPLTVGRMHLNHRLAMAPMTRNRAHVDGTRTGRPLAAPESP
ncbi:hypothetical protein [Corynebacterium nuruki]|uniref:oxidoreductase n=1 Tax=Corynebacterium nuruki TaxID=1032851 RepID=UPI002FDF862D